MLPPYGRPPAAALFAPYPARRTGHRRATQAARRPRAGDRRRRPGLARGAVFGHCRRGPHYPGRRRRRRPDESSAADRAPTVACGPAQGRIGAAEHPGHQSGRGGRCPGGAGRRGALAPAGGRSGRGAGLQRQLRHPTGSERGLRGPPATAGVGRGNRLRRADLRLRHPARRCPLLRLRLPGRGHGAGDGLRDDGRVRATGRHHRQHAGGRGLETAGRHRHPAGGPALLLDARSMEWTQIGVQRAQKCLVCAHSRGV